MECSQKVKQVYTKTCSENMDMDLHNKLTIKSNVAMFGSTILVIFIIVCCWIAPVIVHWCNERQNGQENQPERGED